jgi:hypothetical protein
MCIIIKILIIKILIILILIQHNDIRICLSKTIKAEARGPNDPVMRRAATPTKSSLILIVHLV